MGPGNAKLRDLEEIRVGVRNVAGSLDELMHLDITQIGQARTGEVVDAVWAVLTQLPVSIANAQEGITAGDTWDADYARLLERAQKRLENRNVEWVSSPRGHTPGCFTCRSRTRRRGGTITSPSAA